MTADDAPAPDSASAPVADLAPAPDPVPEPDMAPSLTLGLAPPLALAQDPNPTLEPLATALKRPISVLVVVFTAAGEFLLMNRTRPAGFWQSVTGSLRPGESPRSAAIRELREETGLLGTSRLIDLRQSRLFPIVRAWRDRYANNVCFNREHWFAVCLPHRRIIRLDPAEHSECLWVPLDRAVKLAGSWTNREALRLLAGLMPPAVCTTPLAR
jgi:dATP pyrophosphohydrolase